jgi:hypothetical protein
MLPLEAGWSARQSASGAPTCFATERKASRILYRPSARGPGRFNRLMRPRLGVALSNRLPCLAGLAGSAYNRRGRLIGFFNSLLGRGATGLVVSIEKVVQFLNPFIDPFKRARDKAFLFLLIHVFFEAKLLNELVQASKSDRNERKKYSYIIKERYAATDTFEGRDYLGQLIANEVVLTARDERANLLVEFLQYLPNIGDTFPIYWHVSPRPL